MSSEVSGDMVKCKNSMTSGLVFVGKILMEVNMGRNGNVNNVKEASKRSYINVKGRYSCGKLKRSGSSQARIRRAQRIADELVRKFGSSSSNCYSYFCKCAYCLPENVIWNAYEDSRRHTVRNSLAYFLAVTKSQPQMA